jgi:hypothetical protein
VPSPSAASTELTPQFVTLIEQAAAPRGHEGTTEINVVVQVGFDDSSRFIGHQSLALQTIPLSRLRVPALIAHVHALNSNNSTD